MALRKATEIFRSTVGQEIREIIDAEQGAPAGSYREVQLNLPLSPQVFLSLESEADIKAGLNRVYKLAPMTPGTVVVVELLSYQKIYAASEQGNASIGTVVTYK